MPQLDGLRAIAVLAVFVQHALPNAAAVRLVGPGYYGVMLFFVLSGFLITRILIDCRAAIVDGQAVALTIRRFYARRALRITPVFYVTLLAAAALDVAPVRETFWWHATYLSNVYFARRGDWHGLVTPFWTLAIEEQFYLLWPLVVVLTPRDRLTGVIAVLVAACPIVRWMYRQAGVAPFAIGLLPFGNTEFLLIGALLAAVEARDGGRRLLGRLGLFIGLPAYGLLVTGVLPAWLAMWLANTALGFFLLWLIDRAAHGFTRTVGRVLASRPLRAIGRISYGMYVYQTFVLAFVGWLAAYVAPRLPVSVPGGDAVWLAWRLLAVVTIAALSWRWFEQPIMRLKRHVPYRVPTVPAASVSVPAAVA
jgi:peptidoglycan/LPS O-acetylase OafA/YrhL